MNNKRIAKIITRNVVAETLKGAEKTLHLECGHDSNVFNMNTGVKVDKTTCPVCTRLAN